ELYSIEWEAFDLICTGATERAKRFKVRRCRSDFRQQSLDLRVFIELLRLSFENQIIAHTAGGEIPDACFRFATIRMRVEMSWPLVRFLQQSHNEEEVLNRLGSKAQILIKPRSFLIVQVDVEKLAGFDRLGHDMVEIETRHLFVTDFRIDAHHFRMV